MRIFWGANYTDLLKKNFPSWELRKQNDKNADMKMVFKKTNQINTYEIELFDEKSYQNEHINFALKLATKLKKPPKNPKGKKNPKKKNVTAEQIIRDPEVHAWILHNSKSMCECCEEPSPFFKPDGRGYLEVHHLKRLADDGSDTIENAVAVCPNCHRELHYGKKKLEILESIYTRIKRTIRE